MLTMLEIVKHSIALLSVMIVTSQARGIEGSGFLYQIDTEGKPLLVIPDHTFVGKNVYVKSDGEYYGCTMGKRTRLKEKKFSMYLKGGTRMHHDSLITEIRQLHARLKNEGSFPKTTEYGEASSYFADWEIKYAYPFAESFGDECSDWLKNQRGFVQDIVGMYPEHWSVLLEMEHKQDKTKKFMRLDYSENGLNEDSGTRHNGKKFFKSRKESYPTPKGYKSFKKPAREINKLDFKRKYNHSSDCGGTMNPSGGETWQNISNVTQYIPGATQVQGALRTISDLVFGGCKTGKRRRLGLTKERRPWEITFSELGNDVEDIDAREELKSAVREHADKYKVEQTGATLQDVWEFMRTVAMQHGYYWPTYASNCVQGLVGRGLRYYTCQEFTVDVMRFLQPKSFGTSVLNTVANWWKDGSKHPAKFITSPIKGLMRMIKSDKYAGEPDNKELSQTESSGKSISIPDELLKFGKVDAAASSNIANRLLEEENSQSYEMKFESSDKELSGTMTAAQIIEAELVSTNDNSLVLNLEPNEEYELSKSWTHSDN